MSLCSPAWPPPAWPSGGRRRSGAQHSASACSRQHRLVVRASAQQRLPCLVLPGFLASNTLAADSQYAELRASLEKRRHPTDVLRVQTSDWLPTLAGGSFAWYLERLAEAVRALQEAHGGSKVCLIGVSAGGWLARLALGSQPYEGGRVFNLADAVHTLVCLGTPHSSLENYPFGRAAEPWLRELDVPADVTTSLRYTNYAYPDASSLAPTRIACVCGSAVCGRAVTGDDVRRVLTGALTPKGLRDAWFVAASYVANCGDAAVDGDGVTPLVCADLPGATSLVLPGVWHNAAPGKRWYGSDEVVEQWGALLP